MPTAQISFTLFFLFLYHTTRPYWSSLLVSPRDGTQCSHRADKCKFLPVHPHWCNHVYGKTLLMNSSFFHRQCLAYFVLLIRIVCEMGSKWSYNCYFVGYWFKDFFKKCSILVYFPPSFYCKCFARVQMVEPYSSTDTTTASNLINIYAYRCLFYLSYFIFNPLPAQLSGDFPVS